MRSSASCSALCARRSSITRDRFVCSFSLIDSVNVRDQRELFPVQSSQPQSASDPSVGLCANCLNATNSAPLEGHRTRDKQPRSAGLGLGLSFSFRNGAARDHLKTVQSETLSELPGDQSHLLIKLWAKTLDVLLPRDIQVVDFLYLAGDFLLWRLFLCQFRGFDDCSLRLCVHSLGEYGEAEGFPRA